MHYYKNKSHFNLDRNLYKVEQYISPESGDATPEATEQMNSTQTERAKLSDEIKAKIPTSATLKVDERVEHDVVPGDSVTKIIADQFAGAFPIERLAILSSAFMDKQGHAQAVEGGEVPNIHFLDIGDKVIFDPSQPGRVMIERKEGSTKPNIDWIEIYPQPNLDEKDHWTLEEALESGKIEQNEEDGLHYPIDGYDWATDDDDNFKVIPKKTIPDAPEADVPDAPEADVPDAPEADVPLPEVQLPGPPPAIGEQDAGTGSATPDGPPPAIGEGGSSDGSDTEKTDSPPPAIGE